MKLLFFSYLIILFFLLPGIISAQRCPTGYVGKTFSDEITSRYNEEIISVSACRQIKGSEIIQKVFFTIKNNSDYPVKIWFRFAIDCKDAHREFVGGDSMMKTLPPREEITGSGDNADPVLYREIKKEVSPEADKIDEIYLEIFSLYKIINGKADLIPQNNVETPFIPAAHYGNQDVVLSPPIRARSNALGFYFSSANVVGRSAETDSTNNFPLGMALGGNLQYQHFFSDSSLAYYLHAGYLVWKSEGKVFWDGTGENDSVTGTVIKGKMTAIPVQAGLKYYKKYFYGFVEAGIYFTNKTGSAINEGVEENFLLPPDSVLGKKTSFAFAAGIGYEIKLGKKNFLDLSFRYQDILYPEQPIGFIGFRAGYNLLF